MIEKLTPEQEAQFEVYREKWVSKLNQLKPLTEARVRELLVPVFDKILGKKMPEKLVIARNPLEAWKAVCKHVGLPENSEIVWPYLNGVWSVGYYAWTDYYESVLGLTFTENLKAFTALWEMDITYPLDDITIVSDTLRFCRFDAQKRLHSETGPAIAYDGDFFVYALNGVRVPDWLVTTPAENLDPMQFAKITNVEIRREFVRKVGVERLMTKLGSKVLDKDGDYELHLVDLKGDTGEWPYLKMKNPSLGVWHVECVDKSCRTVAEALKWRNQSEVKPETLT